MSKEKHCFLKKILYSILFLSRQCRIGDKTSAVTVRARCIEVKSCCCRKPLIVLLGLAWTLVNLRKRKSQIKYEGFYCSEIYGFTDSRLVSCRVKIRRLRRSCFPKKFPKFARTTFSQNTSQRVRNINL